MSNRDAIETAEMRIQRDGDDMSDEPDWKWRRLELIDKKYDGPGLDEDEKRELDRLNERIDSEIVERFHEDENDRLQELYDEFDKDPKADHALARLGRQINRAKNKIVRGAQSAAEFFRNRD